MKSNVMGLALLAGLWVFCGPASAEIVINEKAPDFTLTDSRGEVRSLSDYAGQFVVLEWTNYDCPFVRKFYDAGAMQQLQAEYTAEGVVWLSVNSSAPGKQGNYPVEAWNRMIEEKGVAASAVLIDESGDVGRLYGAKTTPHMYIVNPEGSLIYQGAIDSIPSTDSGDIPRATNYVQLALGEAMAGSKVSTPSAKPYGCSVKY